MLYWAPGDNIRLDIGSDKAQEVVVGDAWDGTSQSVRLVSSDGETAVMDGGAGGSWDQAEDLLRTASLPFSDEVRRECNCEETLPAEMGCIWCDDCCGGGGNGGDDDDDE